MRDVCLNRFMRDAWAESDAIISLMGKAEFFGVLRALMILRADFRTLRLQQSLVKQVNRSSAWPWKWCIVMQDRGVPLHLVQQRGTLGVLLASRVMKAAFSSMRGLSKLRH